MNQRQFKVFDILVKVLNCTQTGEYEGDSSEQEAAQPEHDTGQYDVQHRRVRVSRCLQLGEGNSGVRETIDLHIRL